MTYRQFCVSVVLLLLVMPVAAQSSSPALTMEHIDHDDIQRRHWVHLPPDTDEPSGLVLMLHGSNQTGAAIRNTFPIETQANQQNSVNHGFGFYRRTAKRLSLQLHPFDPVGTTPALSEIDITRNHHG